MTEQKFYTAREVAEMLRVQRNTVIKLILTQKLSATVVGKQYRISQEQLDDYFRANTIERKES